MSTNTNLKKIGNPETLLAQFAELVHDGVEAWESAGRILVMLRDDHRWTHDSIIKRLNGAVSLGVLQRFEALGRKRLHPRTLLSSSPAMVRIRLLPYEQQEAALDSKVATLDADGDLMHMRPQDMTAHQVSLAYRNDGTVRTLPEQQEIWKKRKRKFIDTGKRSGWDPDRKRVRPSRISLDKRNEATPLQLLLDELENAQVALVEARRHLEKVKRSATGGSSVALLTDAITAVGKVRYWANNDEL